MPIVMYVSIQSRQYRRCDAGIENAPIARPSGIRRLRSPSDSPLRSSSGCSRSRVARCRRRRFEGSSVTGTLRLRCRFPGLRHSLRLAGKAASPDHRGDPADRRGGEICLLDPASGAALPRVARPESVTCVGSTPQLLTAARAPEQTARGRSPSHPSIHLTLLKRGNK